LARRRSTSAPPASRMRGRPAHSRPRRTATGPMRTGIDMTCRRGERKSKSAERNSKSGARKSKSARRKSKLGARKSKYACLIFQRLNPETRKLAIGATPNRRLVLSVSRGCAFSAATQSLQCVGRPILQLRQMRRIYRRISMGLVRRLPSHPIPPGAADSDRRAAAAA
jgi:hypothetical protein